MCLEVVSPCNGCRHQTDCRNLNLACANYVNKGERGDNPSHHFWLALEGLNVDQCNARMAAMLREGKGCDEVAEHIRSNYQLAVIPHLTFPAELRQCLFCEFWQYIPLERIELTDFLE